MSKDISNTDDVIDSRDVIERIEELRQRIEDEAANLSEFRKGEAAALALDDDERAELKALESLAEEASGYADDWEHGEALIRDSYFQEYAEQLADDIGAINKDASWPNNCIDWERAARELQQDYTAVDFDGVTYWIR